MPLRAKVRVVGEWCARAALIGVLAVALWRSMRNESVTSTARSTKATALAGNLKGIVSASNLGALDIDVDAMPSKAERDLLVALRRTGTRVRWHGAPPVLAVEMSRAREPDNRARLLVVSGNNATVSLVDSVGVLDSLRANSGATIDAEASVGDVRAEQGRFSARAAPAPASFAPANARRAILVLGRPDWESRFAIAALIESGWTVRASTPIAPGVAIRDDGILPIDISRYDAVVALDSSAADLAPAIARFVAAGGGLVAAGSALSLESLRGLAAARAGDRIPGRILLAEDTVTRRDLPLRPLSAVRADGLVLETQAAGPALMARRAGLGRVLVVGYDESWRWRMLGGASGLSAHRKWWSAAVGSVSPDRSVPAPPSGSAAPVAALISALGPSSRAPAGVVHGQSNPLPLFSLLLIAALLLAETGSRRFRGAR